MYKKIVAVLLSGLLLICSATPAFAEETEIVSAPSAALMEFSSGKILSEKNSHEQRPCASITKVMTLLLVFEAIEDGKLSLDDTITASEHASSMGGSDIWLEPGETMSADDMIKATVVASANDAAVALAEHLCGTEDAFVEKMNKRASELGMKDTVFKNCNGLDEDGHLTSANDVAVMARELMKHEKIFDYTSIWLDYLREGKTQIVNTNKLLKTYNGITGLKTGTTNGAGCCMAASATRDGVTFIAVVLGCDTGKQRFADAAALLDYGFANFTVQELKLPENMPEYIAVEGGMKDKAKINCEVGGSVVMKKNESETLETEISLPSTIDSPVEENQRVGTLSFKKNGKAEREFEITAAESVEEVSFGGVFGRLWGAMLKL